MIGNSNSSVVIYWALTPLHDTYGSSCASTADLRVQFPWGPSGPPGLSSSGLIAHRSSLTPELQGEADPLKQLSEKYFSQVPHQSFTRDKVPRCADLNATNFIYFLFSLVEFLKMSGVIALLIVGLKLDSLSFKPKMELVITE